MSSRDSPLVSVVIPTYNRCRLLYQAVDSVLGQSYPRLEVIVVDDGSSDETECVVASMTDKRIRYFRHENCGRARTRNFGIEAARGDFIAFLDDDDLYLPNKLQEQVEHLLANRSLGAVASGWLDVDESGRVLGEQGVWRDSPTVDFESSLVNCRLNTVAVMIHRQWLEAVGGFDRSLELAEDTDLFIRLLRAGCEITWLRKIHWFRRLHDGNSQQDGTKYLSAYVSILDKVFSDSALSREVVAARDSVYAHAYLVGACRQWSAGQIGGARRSLRVAVELDSGLLKNDGGQIYRAIIAHASGHGALDAERFVQIAFGNLPIEARAVAARRRDAIAHAAAITFFRAHIRGSRRAVLASFARAARYSPGWPLNRGVAAVLLQATFGRRPMGVAHRLLGRGRPSLPALCSAARNIDHDLPGR